jgi:hypothetical protein
LLDAREAAPPPRAPPGGRFPGVDAAAVRGEPYALPAAAPAQEEQPPADVDPLSVPAAPAQEEQPPADVDPLPVPAAPAQGVKRG